VAVLLVCCVLPTLLIQGIPDPLFLPSITYTPQQGPPNPALLASRPERLVQRYVADYIGLAGTYPCVPNPTSPYYDEDRDPVLVGQPCRITRPVASYAVISVTIRTHGLEGRPEAIVALVVRYTSGRQWTSAISMYPDRYVSVPLLYFHLDCWSSLGTLQMFGYLVPEIPAGAGYSSPDGLVTYCKDYTGHIVPVGDRHESAPVAPPLAHATTQEALLNSWYDHELVGLVEAVCAQAPTPQPLDSLTVRGAAYQQRWLEVQAEGGDASREG
jgi:hypothetical protein